MVEANNGLENQKKIENGKPKDKMQMQKSTNK
jgi:hypothetical protein